MVHEGEMDIGSLTWVDGKGVTLVSSFVMAFLGTEICIERWMRVDGVSKCIVTEKQIPQIAETYYAAASMIDWHNRFRQQDLQLEKKFFVRNSSFLVSISLFATWIIDSWRLDKLI